MKQAMDGLVQEKLIERKKGKGTFVIYQNKGHNIFSEPSLTRQITSIGSDIYSRVLSAGEGFLEKNISGYFDDSAKPFFKLSRVRYVNNQPLAIETNYIRREWVRNLPEQTLNKISVYQYLENANQLRFDNHHITVRPTLLGVEEKQLLGLEDERVQLIVFKKDIVGVHIGILSSYKGEKIMFTKRILCGNHFQISVDYNPTTREYQFDSIRTTPSAGE